MRTCSHCGTNASPCWRKGPAEKPLLCNACGARWMVKRSLDGYMPGQRSASTSRCATPTRSSSPQTTQQAHRRRSSNTADFASWGDQQQQQQQQQKQEPATVGHRKRAPPRQQPEHSQACPARRCGGHDADQAAAPSSTASGAWSDVSSVEQHQHQGLDLMEVEAPTLLPGPGGEACSIEGGGVIGSSRKRSRLAASSFTLQVMQAPDEQEAALRCRRTYETPDGGLMTVVRRLRKPLAPRASCSH